MFLTKEAFEQHARKLREEKAKEYGLTLEQWDEAVRTGATISPITPHNNIIQPTPNNDNKSK